MSLKIKILLGYGVAFALMGLVVLWAVLHLVSLGRATNAILRENYRSILAAENMVDTLERQDSGILLILLGNRDEGSQLFQRNAGEFRRWLAQAKGNITIEGEREIVQGIETLFEAYQVKVQTLRQGAYKPSLDQYQDNLAPLFAEVRNLCIRLRQLNEATMYNASLQAEEVASRAIWSTIWVAGVALVAALVFSLILAERIVRPLRRFMEASRQISQGDYGGLVPVETRDELGHLAREFNLMTQQLYRYNAMNVEQIIAERNKSKAVLASIDDGLLVFNTQMQVLSVNPAARRLLHLQDELASPLPCEALLPDAELCERIRQTVVQGHPPAIPEEQRIFALADGAATHHFLYSITVIPGSLSAISGIVLTLKDVTRLREVERLKTEFVMAASHELRNPLTSLGMSIDLLMEQAASHLPPKQRDLLVAAQEEVNRMKALVAELLDLSRVESGMIELEFTAASLPELLRHVQEVFRNQLGLKQVDLTLDVKPDLPLVRLDVTQITWVLSNLVSNALRYVAKGGHIALQAHALGRLVKVSVKDDGPGIPQEYQSKIFQKFVQIQGREPGGTGLGLAICKGIVRAHGGSIWVESLPGQGSEFIFTLPL